MNNNLYCLPFNFSKYPCRVYPASVNKLNGDGWAFIAEKNGEDMLIVMGSKAVE